MIAWNVLFDHVAVLNFSAVPLSLQVYATDAIETPSGGFGLLPQGARPTGAGAWISLPSRFATVRVPPENTRGPGQVVIPLELRMPDRASPGDHVGGIVASLRTVGRNASGQNVVLLQRVGTRVFVQVTGKLVPGLSVSGLRASYDGTLDPIGHGQTRISYVVTNTGNVLLGLGQSVSVSGLLGSKRSVVLPNVALLLPGASVPETAVVTGVWPEFLLHATVSARPLAVAGAKAPGLGPISAATSIWAIPWTLIALVVLVVAVGFVAVRARAARSARLRAGVPRVARA